MSLAKDKHRLLHRLHFGNLIDTMLPSMYIYCTWTLKAQTNHFVSSREFECCEWNMPPRRNQKATFHASMRMHINDRDEVQRSFWSLITGYSSRRISSENSLASFTRECEYLTAAKSVGWHRFMQTWLCYAIYVSVMASQKCKWQWIEIDVNVLLKTSPTKRENENLPMILKIINSKVIAQIKQRILNMNFPSWKCLSKWMLLNAVLKRTWIFLSRGKGAL